jgi:hypothetical protein
MFVFFSRRKQEGNACRKTLKMKIHQLLTRNSITTRISCSICYCRYIVVCLEIKK